MSRCDHVRWVKLIRAMHVFYAEKTPTALTQQLDSVPNVIPVFPFATEITP